jgi:hypothetical protein
MKKGGKSSWMYWLGLSVIQLLWMLRQKDHRLEASLANIVIENPLKINKQNRPGVGPHQ